MRRLLKLHHHKHTGKLIHHKHTSYRALLVIFVMAGVCMLFTEQVARADDIVVTATIEAPIPSGKPTFTAPPNGTVTNDPSVDFKGTCPVSNPPILIALYDGSNMIGSSPCQSDGTFAITATIFQGTRSIVATVTTITSGVGQSSDPLTITYTPLTPPVDPGNPTTPTTSPSTPTGEKPEVDTSKGVPLAIIADKPYIVFGQYAPAKWSGYFLGGSPPYSIKIEWGDGDTDTFQNVSTAHQIYMHSYTSDGPFTVSITVVDRNNRSLTRQFAAISPTNFASGSGIITGSNGLEFSSYQALYNLVMYGLYLVALLIMLLLWRLEEYHLALIPVIHFYKRKELPKSRRRTH